MNNQTKRPSDASSEMIQMVLPNDTNTLGNLLGGMLMHWMDLVAVISAKRHCHRPVVTASMDRLDFLKPAKLADIIVLKAQVNRAFKSSMEVGVIAFAEDPLMGEKTHIASAYFTIVAIDENRKPVLVPPITPVTEDEIRRFHQAGERRELRLKERKKG
jgi:acyl-CoA hydrolase